MYDIIKQFQTDGNSKIDIWHPSSGASDVDSSIDYYVSDHMSCVDMVYSKKLANIQTQTCPVLSKLFY